MHKIVVAITGASGSIYAQILLDKLASLKSQCESVAVVMTPNAKEVWKTELDNESYTDYKFAIYAQQDFTAPFASGSGRYDTMIIIPSLDGNPRPHRPRHLHPDLITRAADVVL